MTVLIGGNRRSCKLLWDSDPWQNEGDSPWSFERQLKRRNDNWYYADKEIDYVFNSDGFRAQELDTVIWQESIVMLGCSKVTGIGNALEDSVPVILQDILNIPVINLGVSGTGPDFACWNSLILHEHYPWPKAVIQLWSSIDRYSTFNFSQKKTNSTFNMFGKHYIIRSMMPFMKAYHDINWDMRSKFYINADRALWRDKIIYTEASFFPDTATELNVPTVAKDDYARDGIHPGVKSNHAMAKMLAERLKNNGINK